MLKKFESGSCETTNTIYIYSTETYRKFRGWGKVGQTKQLDAAVRVEQQDGTACPEKLILEREWKVPDWVSDHTVHAELRKMGRMEVRVDKSREWYQCNDVDVATAINNIVHGISRPNNYAMREEQQQCHDQAVEYFKNGGTKFLMNGKMRFGKTFTSYNMVGTLNYKRVLVLTYKPAVDASWREDLETHVNFDGWRYYSSKDFSSTNPIQLPGGGFEVLFASFQDLNDFTKAKWKRAIKYHWDFVIIDEMHYGSGTERAQLSLEQLDAEKFLYVSGTPLKALMNGDFLAEEIYTWGYVDEQRKRREEELTGWATEVYRWLPVMRFHTFEVVEEAKQAVAQYSHDEGFSMTKMFGSDDGIDFLDNSAVKLFLDQVFGIGVNKKNSPLRTHAADHILIVMPPSVRSVSAMCRMLAQRVGHDYKIINVAGDNVKKLEQVKQTIQRNPKTITVTCGRFNTGVTVPEWDLVMMLDDTRAPETYFQTVFRVQSPDPARGKEFCTVIDFNPQRCLEMIYEHADITAKPGQSTQQAVREFLDFAPVLDHSQNKIKTVDTEQILKMMSETGGYAERFGSSTMMNWGLLDTVSDLLDSIDPESSDPKSQQIADNGLVRGKNYQPKSKTTVKKSPDLLARQERDLKLRATTMLRRLPTYLFLEQAKIDNVQDIIYNNNNSLFYPTVGITIPEFEELCQGFINTQRLDRAIMAYQQGL